MSKKSKGLVIAIAVVIGAWLTAPAGASELNELRATVQSMQKSMEQMQKRIAELEQENHRQKRQASASRTAPLPAAAVEPAAGSASVAGSSDQVVTIAPTAVTIEGRASEIKDRPAMDDQQEAAPRPNDLTLDPKYRGFVPIPNTPTGAAMLPTTIIKEANPPQLAGSTTGIVNFINFSLSALLGPVFGARLTRSPGDTEVVGLAHHQAGFTPLLYGILVALILSFFLRETGPARKT